MSGRVIAEILILLIRDRLRKHLAMHSIRQESLGLVRGRTISSQRLHLVAEVQLAGGAEAGRSPIWRCEGRRVVGGGRGARIGIGGIRIGIVLWLCFGLGFGISCFLTVSTLLLDSFFVAESLLSCFLTVAGGVFGVAGLLLGCCF